MTFWYPSLTPETPRQAGIFRLTAAFEAPPAPGRFGLVAFSHGSGGGDLNHHDWAEALARAGYVVVAPRHLGDSHDAERGIGSREQLLGRPRQLRAALDAALTDPALGGLIDADRMGVLGFSAGGYTALILLGARPDFSRWATYCGGHPDRTILCPVGKAPLVPKTTPDDWLGVQEPRLRAAVLMAPFALLFDDRNLGRVTVPVRLYRARDDLVATNPENADHVARCLPSAPEAVTVAGNHYVFIAPIEEALARKYSEFYLDPPGVDRRATHARIAGELVDFFGRRLPPRA